MFKRSMIVFLAAVSYVLSPHTVECASCPGSKKYATITYNHRLVNRTVNGGTYTQVSSVFGPIGIQVSPQGVSNAGNNKVTRTIDLAITTPTCDCLSETATSLVTATINGSCSNGVLKLNFTEVYPDSSAQVTCTGDDSCPTYTQQFIGTTRIFASNINYIDGNLVIQPYDCTNCSGNYSWLLNLVSKPPPSIDVPLVPIVPMINILLND